MQTNWVNWLTSSLTISVDIGMLLPVWLVCVTAAWVTVRLFTKYHDHLGWLLLAGIIGTVIYTPIVYWLASL